MDKVEVGNEAEVEEEAELPLMSQYKMLIMPLRFPHNREQQRIPTVQPQDLSQRPNQILRCLLLHCCNVSKLKKWRCKS